MDGVQLCAQDQAQEEAQEDALRGLSPAKHTIAAPPSIIVAKSAQWDAGHIWMCLPLPLWQTCDNETGQDVRTQPHCVHVCPVSGRGTGRTEQPSALDSECSAARRRLRVR